MPRKTIDPKRLALLDRQAKLRSDYERAYTRLKRAFTRMEKCRQALIRLGKRLDALDAETMPRPTH
jgi:hypothetical protein